MQVVGTTDISTASTSFVDMANMNLSITTRGGNLLIMFNGVIQTGSNDGGNVQVGIVLDGATTIVGESTRSQRNSDYNFGSLSLSWLATGLCAGNHVVKIQWKSGIATALQYGSTYKRVLQIIEF